MFSNKKVPSNFVNTNSLCPFMETRANAFGFEPSVTIPLISDAFDLMFKKISNNRKKFICCFVFVYDFMNLQIIEVSGKHKNKLLCVSVNI